MATKSSDIIIIGAGVIGCAIAWRLAQKGADITLIDKGEPGEEASWAAAGMLAPHVEAGHSVPQALTELFSASHALYPEFLKELQRETGIDIPYQKCGSLLAATDFREAELLAGTFERLQQQEVVVQEVTAAEIPDFEPALSQTVQSALFYPDDGAVNNRILLQALIEALKECKIRIITNTEIRSIGDDGSRATTISSSDEKFRAGTYILTAGCWSGQIEMSAKTRIPVRPIRGQIVCLERDPQILRHLIHTGDCYIVPWPDGRILIGSTMENVGFDKSVTAAGVHQLLGAAIKVVPDLRHAQMMDVWAGLRPDTPDNLPILGPSAFPNLIFATGHFRNGILLTPITAKIVSELVADGHSSHSVARFSHERFTSKNN